MECIVIYMACMRGVYVLIKHSSFVLLSLLAHLGCTERSLRLAGTTITSTPRSVNVEVRSISNLLVDQGGLLPVRAMECQLFM